MPVVSENGVFGMSEMARLPEKPAEGISAAVSGEGPRLYNKNPSLLKSTEHFIEEGAAKVMGAGVAVMSVSMFQVAAKDTHNTDFGKGCLVVLGLSVLAAAYKIFFSEGDGKKKRNGL